MNDERDPLLDEIGATLSVEPSSALAAKVRADIVSERMGWTWRAHLLVAAPVMLALTMVGAVWLNREAAPELPARAPTVTTAEVAVGATPGTPGFTPPPSPARVVPSRKASVRSGKVREPEALIARDQADGLRRWMAWVREGRAVPPAGWPAVNEETGELLPLPEIAEIEVPAVAIEPLPGSTGGDDAQTIGVDD